jgi:hypothetical protein
MSTDLLLKIQMPDVGCDSNNRSRHAIHTDYNITMHKGGVDHKPLQSRPDDVPERRVL